MEPEPTSTRGSLRLVAGCAVVLGAAAAAGWAWQERRTAARRAEVEAAAREALSRAGPELAACLAAATEAGTVRVSVAVVLDGAGLADVRVQAEPAGRAPAAFSACAGEAVWAQAWPAVEGGYRFADALELTVGG